MIKLRLNNLLIPVLLLIAAQSMAQNRIVIRGNVSDPSGNALELVNVSIFGLPHGATTDAKGDYQFRTIRKDELRVMFSSLGYESKSIIIATADYPSAKSIEVNAILNLEITAINEIIVSADRGMEMNLIRIDPLINKIIPSASGNFEAILKPLPGVSSSNELSSQYSVRGGNFDENMVYVNDIEVYRPILIRSGQQEGLSFINPDMVSSVLFSAGGFDAKYGDKMSSDRKSTRLNSSHT